MNVEELLVLLDYPVVAQRIRKIVKCDVAQGPGAKSNLVVDCAAENELNALKGKLKELENINAGLSSENDNLKQSIREYNEKLSESNCKLNILIDEKNNIKDMFDNTLHQYNEQKEATTAINKKCSYLKAENQLLTERIGGLEEIIEDLRLELNKRFSDGWDLYLKYRELNNETKQLLTSVFPRDSFKSFISGGAKDKSLEKIWDETCRNLSNGNEHIAYLLWDIFIYFLDMVNKGKTEDVYQVDDVNIGDPYDKNIHSIDATSRVQGCVGQVYLPGYSNLYNDTVVRKSIVHIE